MKVAEIAQWVIDNRFPKSENEKITDFEMYHLLLDSIEAYAKDQIEKDRERIFDVYQSDTTWNEFKHIIETVPIILD